MKVLFSRNLFIILGLDIALLIGAFIAAHLIRFDFSVPAWAMTRLFEILPYLLVVKLFCFYLFDMYKGMWRYTSLNDFIDIIKASSVASLILIVFILFKTRFDMVSRSVFIIDWCLTLILLISLRLVTRICFEQFSGNVSKKDLRDALVRIFRRNTGSGKKVIIIGAGDCGQKICREFIENPAVESHVVGFLDDDPKKIGRKIHGIPVLSSIEDLENTVTLMDVNDVVIAIPSARPDRMRHIIELCKAADINHKIVPNMGELIDGKINISAIRNVEYRDLLGRGPVSLDKKTIGQYLGQKCVLVTGAGGSIGTGLCRQICRYAPRALVLFERAESPLYEIDLELKKSFPGIDIIPVLGDIQNMDELHKVFSQTRPDIVFHAAAYKHVPMLEKYPWKAVENNVKGTQNLIRVTQKFMCRKFVFVSTDKAVNPTSVMGTSKRISELLVQQANRSPDTGTRFIIVRFGNVIGSVGSVIPLFKKQIRDGGPVTVTHPDITRYFMLIPEACQLILQAGGMGAGGEIFILEMGSPVKIDSMARDLIRFSGLEPDVDIKIQYTGLRPGEKLYEELITDQENIIATSHRKIMVLNSREPETADLDETVERLKEAARKRDIDQMVDLFQKLVPEYQPTGNNRQVA